MKAIPIDKKELGECDPGRKIRRVSQPDPLIFGGFPPPPLHHPYEATVREKMCFHSITVMKVSNQLHPQNTTHYYHILKGIPKLFFRRITLHFTSCEKIK